MDKARAAVSQFTSRKGHTTDVTESVAPAVTSEHIKPTRHEELTEAVDREVHQDHYHTTIQPIQHQEILPEQHQHQMKPIIEKEFHHGNEHETRQRLEAELAQFKNTTHTHETRHTTAAAPRVEGEHVHHHVHETVQPVVHKETITPEVVHTTVPIHESHHAAAQHHGISTLPMKTLESFTSGGGILKGGQTSSHETYEGAPRPYNRELMSNPTEADLEPGKTGLGSGAHHTGGTGLSGRSDRNNFGNDGLSSGMRPDSGYSGSNTDGINGNGLGRDSMGANGDGRQFGEITDHKRGNNDLNTTTNTTTSTSTEHKPSMIDRLNPLKKTST